MSAARERLELDAFLARQDEVTAAELRVIADRIDRLARIGDALEGVEQRYLPWAIATGVLFVAGLMVFVSPGIFLNLPRPLNYAVLALCLSGLPLVAILYARRVLPRSKADAEIEHLNRDHFLPRGGLYFAPGARPAAVILVDWTPPEAERPLSEAPRDPRKRRDREDVSW